MHVAALRVDLRLRDVHSLKEKRRIVKSVSADLMRTFNVAVAEVDHQDLWQRTTLGIAAVSSSAGHLDRVLHSVERTARSRNDAEVLSVEVEYLERTG